MQNKKPTSEIKRRGLTAVQVTQRLKLEGYNELPSKTKRSFFKIIFEVIREPMFALLIGGGLVYFLLGSHTEAILLLVFAGLSIGITIVQETRSENVLEALRNLASPRANVIRDGSRVAVAGREVVREDILVVGEGDRIAADATLFQSSDLLVDESLLTGESVAVRKLALDGLAESGSQSQAPAPGGEDLPYVYAGTLVVRGSGHALVQATGVQSEMGKIGRALGSIETEQPHLQKQIRWLVRDFAIFGIVAGALVVGLFGLLRGSWLEAMLAGIAIGMSLLPEEFPLVMSVFMAMGAWRISKARVLTRRASAIETLGATTILCTDKTGTLTENRMTVTALVNKAERWTNAAGPAMSDSLLSSLGVAWRACAPEPTDPMDLAVDAVVIKQRAEGLACKPLGALLRSYGLRPDLFVVANVYLENPDGSAVGYAKGAVEAIAELCHLSANQLSEIRAQADQLAKEGVRVLGLANTVPLPDAQVRSLPASPRDLSFEFMGLIGFSDPLRPNVPAAVSECRSAGIRVVMITGDYPVTARAIAGQAGIDHEDVLSGDEIEGMSDAQLALKVKSTSVFARIRPNQKLRIVESFKANGDIVAMTGDGVNDAPAIKAAHIGIAMGGRGTDVAREAAAIVLLDDDFDSIVKTIRLGRRIYDNLRKAIEFIVAVHIPIAGLAIFPLLLGYPLILTPIHIAFLEMVIDPACSVVFEAEEEEDDVMKRPPRDPKSSLLLPKRIGWALLQGLTVFAVLAGAFIFGARQGMAKTELHALVFTLLVLLNVALILVNRSFKSSLTAAFLRPNPFLWILISGVTLVLSVALFWPPAQSLFQFGQLHWDDLAMCFFIGVLSLFLLEFLKHWFFRGAGKPRLPI